MYNLLALCSSLQTYFKTKLIKKTNTVAFDVLESMEIFNTLKDSNWY